MNAFFKAAPISRQIKLLTVVASVILLGVFGILASNEAAFSRHHLALTIFPGVLLVGTLLWAISTMVRGYELQPGALVIIRLSGRKIIPLDTGCSIFTDPLAMKKSWRIVGNGGFFSFTGLFRNSTLGNFNAYVSDPDKAVVVKTARRTYVISPDQPELFVAQFRAPAQPVLA